MKSQQNHSQDEQLWQAFRYVAAEFSVVEAEAFEQQMLQDSALCEAVAEATMLSSSVAASGRRYGPIAPPIGTLSLNAGVSQRYRTVAFTAATCCCLALVIILSGHSDISESPTDDIVQTDIADAELLVAAWVENLVGQTDDESEYDDFNQQDLAVPDWMLADVTLSEIEGLERRDMPVDDIVPDDMELF
jgi:hypothetical protein